jgi:hypothetical protein
LAELGEALGFGRLGNESSLAGLGVDPVEVDGGGVARFVRVAGFLGFVRLFGWFPAGGFDALQLFVELEVHALSAAGDEGHMAEDGAADFDVGIVLAPAGFVGVGAPELPLRFGRFMDQIVLGRELRLIFLLETRRGFRRSPLDFRPAGGQCGWRLARGGGGGLFLQMCD